MAMEQASNHGMESCIAQCLECYRVCSQMALNHCLERGGRHVEPHHFRLMINCAQICRTAADFMLAGSELHVRVCAVCAEVCEACAESCEELDMPQCVEACHLCADSCRQMANPQPGKERAALLQPAVTPM